VLPVRGFTCVKLVTTQRVVLTRHVLPESTAHSSRSDVNFPRGIRPDQVELIYQLITQWPEFKSFPSIEESSVRTAALVAVFILCEFLYAF